MDIKLPAQQVPLVQQDQGGVEGSSNLRVVASDNMNIVMAVNMGGDDFIAAAFDLDVLTAKIQALLRRTYDFAGQRYGAGA